MMRKVWSILGNESKVSSRPCRSKAVKLFERVVPEMGSIEILINNAGIAEPAPIDMSQEEWDAFGKNPEVNLHSPAIYVSDTTFHSEKGFLKDNKTVLEQLTVVMKLQNIWLMPVQKQVWWL